MSNDFQIIMMRMRRDLYTTKSVISFGQSRLDLSSRREELVITSSTPNVLLSTTGINRICDQLNLNIGSHPLLEYSGSLDTTMYFSRIIEDRQSGKYTAVLYKIKQGSQLELFRRVFNSSRAIFLHRQPYYILRTGMMFYDYHLHDFEGNTLFEIDFAGESLENCQKVYHKGNIILIRKEDNTKVIRMSKNVIVVSDPKLNEKCKFYTGEHTEFVYVTNEDGLFFIVNTIELTIRKCQFKNKADIRCVCDDIAILATKDGMVCYKMTAVDWKTRSSLSAELEQLENNFNELQRSSQRTIDQLKATIANDNATNVAQKKENNRVYNQMRKDLAAANEVLEVEKATSNSLRLLNEQCTSIIDKKDKKIQMLLDEISEVTEDKNRAIREVREKAAKEKAIYAAKEREQWKEIVKLKLQHAQTVAAEVERQGEERMRMEKESKRTDVQLEKKYRRMLLMFARPGMDDQIKNELENSPYPVVNVMKLEETIENTLVVVKISQEANEEHGQDEMKKSSRNRRKHRYNRKNDPECLKTVEKGKSEETNRGTLMSTTEGNNSRLREERKDKNDTEKNRKNQNEKGGKNHVRKEYFGKKYSDFNH